MDFYIKIHQKNNDRFSDILKMLDENGEYYIHIERIPDDKPEQQYRAQFFAKVTELSYHSGYKKQELYEMFKHEKNISTTKDISKEEWCALIQSFYWWAISNFDVIL